MGMDIAHTGAITVDPPIPHDELVAANLPLRDVKPRIAEHPVEGVPGAYRRIVTAIEPAIQVFSGYGVAGDLQLIADQFGDGRTFGGRIECSWSFDGGGQLRHIIRDGRAIQVKPTIVWPTLDDDEYDMPTLLAAVDNALRNGSRMTGANLAFEYLCSRLGADRAALRFRPGWRNRSGRS